MVKAICQCFSTTINKPVNGFCLYELSHNSFKWNALSQWKLFKGLPWWSRGEDFPFQFWILRDTTNHRDLSKHICAFSSWVRLRPSHRYTLTSLFQTLLRASLQTFSMDFNSLKFIQFLEGRTQFLLSETGPQTHTKFPPSLFFILRLINWDLFVNSFFLLLILFVSIHRKTARWTIFWVSLPSAEFWGLGSSWH